MAALGEGWEMDYDGSAGRWFYRYKPTNHIQYSFPKEGDEYPWEYVGDVAAKVDLAPEEKLVSQQQVKRRSTLGDSSSKQASGAKRREQAVSNVSSEQDDGGSPFWLQPDALMYMGPGAYTDISPLQEEDEERADGGGEVTEEKDAADGTTAEVSPAKTTVSPVTSAEATPLAHNIQPATAAPEVESAVIVESSDYVAAEPAVEQPPEIPLLDSKEVPRNPLGLVAELSSELTPQCEDEINPAPVELPSNEMMDTSEPVLSYASAFELAPVELPTDTVPRRRSNFVEEKSLPSQTTLQQERQQHRARQAAQESPKRTTKPVQQSSMPQSTSSVAPTSNTASEQTLGKYQPYNPATGRAPGEGAVNRYSVADIRHLEPARDNKRHSLAGSASSHVQPSVIPAALLPPHVPPKRPLDAADTGRQTGIPGYGERHEGVVGAIKPGSGDLAHFPSVLKPARGRPVIRAQTPPQSQGASPARSYQAYKPYRDLQKDIEETVQLFSNTGYSQGTTTSSEASHSDRPQISRTSTLPADLPALPFMGVRPHLPASSTSAPVTLQNLQSRQAHADESRGGVVVGREADPRLPEEHSVPLPSSSPDLPPPLSLSRKSSAPRASLPTAFSSSQAPTTTEANLPPEVVTPAADTVIVSPNVQAGSGSEENSARGAVGETESHAERAVGATQPDLPASIPSVSGETERSEGTEHSSQSVSSRQLSPATSTRHTPPEQVPGGSSVIVVAERSISPAAQVVVSTQPSVVSPPEVGDPSVSVTSSAVESPPDVPPAVQSTTATSPVPGAKSPSPSQPLPSEAETTTADQHLEGSASEVGLQQTDRLGASQLGVAASGDITLPAGQTEQNETPSAGSASAIPPWSEGCQPSLGNAANGGDIQQQVTPAQPSANTRALDPFSTALQNNVPSMPSATAVVAAGVSQDSSSADQASLDQDARHAPAAALAPSPMAPSSQIQSSAAPAYAIPAGHHPLGSHPANPAHASPSGVSASVKEHQAPPDAAASGSQKIPQRALSQPAISPSAQAHPVMLGAAPHPGMPGTAPPQMAAMYPPPAMPSGMPPGMMVQSGPSGIPPQQQYPFHPGGMFPQLQQAGLQEVQHSPMGPHFMMQPSQTMPAAAYVMQPNQLSQPPKEKRSWFGLFRSESVRTTANTNVASQPNKLQKASHPPIRPAFLPPQQPHPNQPVPHASFVPAHSNIHPHAMTRPTHQPQPGQHNLQQQLQKLKTLPESWKNNAGNGSQQAASVNKFQVPNRDPNSSHSIIPPPDVRQAIQSQEQRLAQTNSGQAAQGGQQYSQGQGQGQGEGLGLGQGAQGGRADPTSSGPAGAAGNKNAGGQWGNASAYDGADWGDDGDF